MTPGPRSRLLAAVLVAARVLAGCGGGTEVSWCLGGDGFSAGYNTSQCPPDPHDKPAEATP